MRNHICINSPWNICNLIPFRVSCVASLDYLSPKSLDLSVTHECYFRIASCALNYISAILFLHFVIFCYDSFLPSKDLNIIWLYFIIFNEVLTNVMLSYYLITTLMLLNTVHHNKSYRPLTANNSISTFNHQILHTLLKLIIWFC